jgi:hypothetical protein
MGKKCVISGVKDVLSRNFLAVRNAGELYQPLMDLSLFNQVQIDPEAFTLVWPSADFDPATLQDWPQQLEALKTLFWTTTAAINRYPSGEVNRKSRLIS